MLNLKPEIVKRQGEELFIKIPVYSSKAAYKVLYANHELYTNIFQDGIDLPADIEKNIANIFSVTVNKEKAHDAKQVAWAYVDKQEDPLNISMRGNLGSGRAYHLGKYFNIKGEKTPLAVSDSPNYSNGFLYLYEGLWETVIANALSSSFSNPTFLVLAVLDTDEFYFDHKKQRQIKLIKIIRVAKTFELDRVSHLFYLKKQMSNEFFSEIITNLAVLEADKFIERILHGTWSAGNVSPHGNLIDFHTVCCVKERNPQFNYTKNWLANYFGFEDQGQIKLLKAIQATLVCHDDWRININEQFGKIKLQHLSHKLLYLLGFDPKISVPQNVFEQIVNITEMFVILSKKFYLTKYELSSALEEVTDANVYNFSWFFRFFGLFMMYSKANYKGIIINFLFNESKFDYIKNLKYTDNSISPVTDEIVEEFKCYIVTDDTSIDDLRKEAYKFINLLCELYGECLKYSKFPQEQVTHRAYLLNEDRKYLQPRHDIIESIARNVDILSNSEIKIWLNSIITACKRIVNDDEPYQASDHTLFHEGMVFLMSDAKQHFFCLGIYAFVLGLNIDHTKFNIISDLNFSNQPFKSCNTIIYFKTEPIPNKYLLRSSLRKNQSISVEYLDKKIGFTLLV